MIYHHTDEDGKKLYAKYAGNCSANELKEQLQNDQSQVGYLVAAMLFPLAETLKSVMNESEEAKFDVAHQLLNLVESLHKNGFCHGDIKGDNLFKMVTEKNFFPDANRNNNLIVIFFLLVGMMRPVF